MKQLVESSRQELGGGSATGCLVMSQEKPIQSHDATVPAYGAAQPSSTALGGQAEQRGAGAAAAGTVLQVSAIPPGVLDRAELTDFYCCSRCGKVFWEGSHLGRLVSQFQDVLGTAEDQQSLSELS